MQFVKMHGAGNDYVYVDCFDQTVPNDVSQLAIAVSDRHRGIGADGLILIGRSKVADARMQMFNADGSEAEMCANGVRCVAKYLYDQDHVRKKHMEVETGKGIVQLSVFLTANAVDEVRVNLGAPILDAEKIPTTLNGNPPLEQKIEVSGETFCVNVVSMGNPHCIIFVDQLTDQLVHHFGALIENHSIFPQRTNVEFVQVESRSLVNVRVWERGTGETQACGSGASAVVVASSLLDHTDREITCCFPGGDLRLEWARSGNVYLTGPATEVFRGTWSP